ncbi:MAG: MFS transporter [Candidatus Binatia bacterium]
MESHTSRILLANLMLGSFLTGTASRIFAISLPTVAENLQTDIAGISWALISFQLSTISLSLVFGRMGDLYGRQTVFGMGLLVFTASSFLCGLSQDILQLVFFRLLQGVGAAMIQAQGRALAMEAVPQDSVGKAQGFLTTAHHSGFLLGPSLGGLIIDYVHWRGIFFSLVPIGTAGALLFWVNQKGSSVRVAPAKTATRSSVDYLGAALLVATALALIAILDRRVMEVVPAGWRTVLILAFFGFLIVFFIREATASSPILILPLFRIRMFTFSTACLLLVSINFALTAFLLPFYLQEILHLSPSFMGILFMSAPIFTIALSPVGGYIFDTVGSRLPATTGTVVFGVASFLGIMLRTDSHWFLPTLMIALGGLASALFYPSNHSAMIGSVPAEHRGIAAGTIYMMFGLGNTFGITLGSFLMTAAFRFHTGLSTATPTTENPAAFVASLNTTFLLVVGIAVLGMVLSLMRGKEGKG